ncbi:hypothetical protein OAA57_00145 [bacterium]|jgi:hypothetical protein|nr:hypothetical protein [bacterium]MDB4349971.1 hypothetical protein [bacterium]
MSESKARLIAGNFTTTGTPADVTGSTGAGGGGGGVDSAGTLSLVGIDGIVREHSHTISANYTLDSAKNGLVAGPIFIDSGVTITINDSATLVIA